MLWWSILDEFGKTIKGSFCCASSRTIQDNSAKRYTFVCDLVHQDPKVNRYRLAFFIAGSCVFAEVYAGACGLRDLGMKTPQGPIPLSPALSSLAPSRVKILKSASNENAVVTNQRVTRGLFKRLDSVIAWPKEITNPRLAYARSICPMILCTKSRTAVPYPCGRDRSILQLIPHHPSPKYG
jgi:hypothetical protein